MLVCEYNSLFDISSILHAEKYQCKTGLHTNYKIKILFVSVYGNKNAWKSYVINVVRNCRVYSRVTYMNKILFVRGFNAYMPDNDAFDGYASIRTKYKMTYFDYSPAEDILAVYERLKLAIKSGFYTHLIGHSMGGGLLMRYMNDHVTDEHVKFILLMPLVYKTPVNSVISKIPFADYIRVPKALAIPNSKLYEQGNLMNDNYTLLSMSQVVGMYNHIMLDSEEFVKKINDSNCVMFYASQEAFNTVPAPVLQQIHKLEIVQGLHECFNSVGRSTEFFDKLAKYLQ